MSLTPPQESSALLHPYPPPSSSGSDSSRCSTAAGHSSTSPHLPSSPSPFYTSTGGGRSGPRTLPAIQPPSYGSSFSTTQPLSASGQCATRAMIAHPYARLAAKKGGSKRRKIWNHALEKSIFTPHELSTIGAPNRRTIYIASLEAHIDRLHTQLLDMGLYPVPFERLEPFRGLNSKTAKSLIAGLQHDDSFTKLKLLELQRANESLKQALSRPDQKKLPLDGRGTPAEKVCVQNMAAAAESALPAASS